MVWNIKSLLSNHVRENVGKRLKLGLISSYYSRNVIINQTPVNTELIVEPRQANQSTIHIIRI